MATSPFWTGTLDRAVKSFAQSLLLIWGGDTALNLIDVNVPQALGLAAGAALISLLTSIVSRSIGDDDTTSALRGGR